ncbi:MAG: glycoside hydrolase family 31 protein [Fusicatenibacter sp.]|nr:glycoside hydrolase family 31 protein [Fusicatenibacter sp.]
MKEYMKLQTCAAARPENVIQGDCYRVTVLTKSLVRVEYSADGIFTDQPTQTVLYRDFPPVDFRVKETEDGLLISTEYFQLCYDRREFSSHGLSLACKGVDLEGMPGGNMPAWRYGSSRPTLKGTARTLDNVDGACALEEGLMSYWNGCACLADSRTLTLTGDGWVEPRKTGISDIYLFAYGHRYREALKDFYRLCGRTPMLPRFALGNWWSRYYPYTEESYLELMEQFDKEKISFSVAVIDMDWHLVDIDPKYGTGWTGFTWNKELFPEPERFLQKLHDRGMKVTLNLHPADGIRSYEECYPRMAKRLGWDISEEEPVNFDIADPDFTEAYFEEVLHPMEKEGVDFWWIDWQQGTDTKVKGLDPLWMLNHFHYLDSKREGRRAMTFSRYAGPGSHRYPIGFSGDTVISWDSLDFQPYFTSTASNIGYGWWSHDIGGHMMGSKNDELEARWYQFGVFSPINRLHSSSSIFNGKEPWRFKKEVRETMDEFLRLRHRLIPYLYTMNYRAFAEGEPICQPMYYEYPTKWESYQRKNQYFFGSELMVIPITTPRIAELNAAEVKVWLPKGLWFDFFTDTVYQGGRSLCMYRGIDSIPVLAKAGAIVPMTEEILSGDVGKNPQELTVRIYPGADNSFVLYEDENDTEGYLQGICVKTKLSLDWDQKRFVIEPVEGREELIPKERTWQIRLQKITAAKATVRINGVEQSVRQDKEGSTLAITLCQIRPQDRIEIELPADCEIAGNSTGQQLYEFLNQAEIRYFLKDQIYGLAAKHREKEADLMGEMQVMGVSEPLQRAVLELVNAYDG